MPESTFAAVDGNGRVFAYSAAATPQAFLQQLLGDFALRQKSFRIHHICPYVWTGPVPWYADLWYAEQEPLLVHHPSMAASDPVAGGTGRLGSSEMPR